MKLFTLLLTFIFIIPIVQAQPKIYLRSTSEMFPTTFIVKGETSVKYTEMNSGKKLRELFKDNATSYQHIKDYSDNATKFHAIFWGGLGLALFYITSTDNEDFSSITYFSVLGAGIFGSAYYGGRAKASFYKAINTYNDVPEEFSFNRVRKISPKLSYSWRF